MNLTLKKKIIILNIIVALLLAGCGKNSDNAEQINSTTTTTPVTVTPIQDTNVLKSLSLKMDKTTLNKDENTTLQVMATYGDGTGKNVTQEVEWVMTPEDSVAVNGSILTAKKDNPTTLKAKVGNTFSNTLNLNITWVVDGHTLPPEPDKTLDDSTLLGIDVNDNGVRDDVERWIYEEYKDKHPIHIDIGMQAGRAYKLVLETPERAKEIHYAVSAPLSCEAYYQIYAKYFNEPLLISQDIVTKYFRKRIYFNTNERMDAYIQYDTLLSGDIYITSKIGDGKKLCDFNSSKYKE